MVWNPGDDTDLDEGGDGSDTVEVNGGNGAEQFTATANGTRVRFDRVTPAPFSIDIGTSEALVVNANGGADSFAATGNLAPLIGITFDGGADNDTISGGNGADVLLGGIGNDVVDGNQGDDRALLGAGDDTFQWDPGDGSDVVEGQDGADTLVFNGSNIAENIDASANGQRVRLFRNVANVTMDADDIERLDIKARGGADTLRVNDLTGTDVTSVLADLNGQPAGDDGAADNVIVNGTNGDDVVFVTGQGDGAQVSGLPAQTSVAGAIAASDRLTIAALGRRRRGRRFGARCELGLAHPRRWRRRRRAHRRCRRRHPPRRPGRRRAHRRTRHRHGRWWGRQQHGPRLLDCPLS